MAPIVEAWSEKLRTGVENSANQNPGEPAAWKKYSPARKQLINSIAGAAVSIEFDGATALMRLRLGILALQPDTLAK